MRKEGGLRKMKIRGKMKRIEEEMGNIKKDETECDKERRKEKKEGKEIN